MADLQQINPETATLEELRALAMSSDLTISDDARPRDEQGRFVAATTAAVDEPVEFVREIDLGDGSGVQVFKADTAEGLIDKLADAQRNATLKIRELSAVKPPPAAAVVEEPAFTEEQEWLIGQELMTKPSEAFGKLFEKMVGVPLAKFKSERERVAAFTQAQSEMSATDAFLAATPDYVAVPANGAKLEKYLTTFGLEGTLENITKAYKDLSDSGLLVTERPAAAAEENAETETESPERTRIANRSADDVAPRRKAASGLSARRSAPTTKSLEPTEAEMNSMSLEQLRDKALEALRNG